MLTLKDVLVQTVVQKLGEVGDFELTAVVKLDQLDSQVVYTVRHKEVKTPVYRFNFLVNALELINKLGAED